MGEVSVKGSSLKIVVIFLFVVILCLIVYIIFSKDNKVEYSVNGNGLLDISKLSDYVNYDGTYASIKTMKYTLDNGSFYINLDMEGKVYVGFYSERKDITNVKNVIDILGIQSDTGLAEDAKCYMLIDDGSVYEYSLDNILNNKYEAKLVDNVNKVKRIFSYAYASSEGVNSVTGVMVILENGEYVKLD